MLGIVTGLKAEARVANPLGLVLAGGAGPRGAARAAARLADEGATALLSFGLAGGLSPTSQPGTLIIPAEVLADDDRFATDAALTAWLGGVTGGTHAAAAATLASAADKRALHARTGADAVDLESGAIAAVARARGLPFAALRAVCDTADTDLPPASLVALNSRGEIMIERVLLSLLEHPRQFGALIRLSRQAAAARTALARRVATLAAGAPFGAT
jgi:adenosylhomocysteine nucleosidase